MQCNRDNLIIKLGEKAIKKAGLYFQETGEKLDDYKIWDIRDEVMGNDEYKTKIIQEVVIAGLKDLEDEVLMGMISEDQYREKLNEPILEWYDDVMSQVELTLRDYCQDRDIYEEY